MVDLTGPVCDFMGKDGDARVGEFIDGGAYLMRPVR
jgi:hypothetical protein